MHFGFVDLILVVGHALLEVGLRKAVGVHWLGGVNFLQVLLLEVLTLHIHSLGFLCDQVIQLLLGHTFISLFLLKLGVLCLDHIQLGHALLIDLQALVELRLQLLVCFGEFLQLCDSFVHDILHLLNIGLA